MGEAARERHKNAETREKRVLDNLRLVGFIASRIRASLPPAFELEDLISAGVLGLLKAADTYPEKGSFSGWASFCIRAAIIDSIRGEPYWYASHRANLAEVRAPEDTPPSAHPELDAALAALSPAERQILALVHEQDRSVRSIGRSGELGIGRRRVEKTYRAALERLRQQLAGDRAA